MKKYYKNSGHSIPGIDDGWAIYGKTKDSPPELLAVVDTETMADGLIELLKQGQQPQPDFTLNELGSTYVDEGDRFIVSLIVSYDGKDVKTPQEAVAAALALTTDDNSDDTQWYCFDRKSKKLQMIEQKTVVTPLDDESEDEEETDFICPKCGDTSTVTEDQINYGGDPECGNCNRTMVEVGSLTPENPNDLFAPENFLFWKQQAGLWCNYLLAGKPDLEGISVDDEQIRSAFEEKDTPHDFIERQIPKYDLIRPDPMEMMGKKPPECPYHKDSQL